MIQKNSYKFNYISKDTKQIRYVYFLTFVTWLMAVAGMSKFFDLNPIYWLIAFPFFIPVWISRTVTYFVNIFYPKFDLELHNKKRDKYLSKNQPTVDVFLPIAGEDTSILKPTWEAVSKIAYENYKVHVLEDKIDPKARVLASRYGFNYLSRPNKGFKKKGGNLEYGYSKTSGEFALVLDADFVPHPDILKDTLPYMEDKNIGIVQTPQYFRTSKEINKKSPIEYGSANVVEDFYRIIQPARDFFGAAICVGTNALYRRKAIPKLEESTLNELSEDIVTGIALLENGYRLKYIPLILAVGLCPDNVESYFKQHNRWATGSMLLLMSSFFWRIRMTIMQRLIYISGSMYYLAEAASLFLTSQVMLLLLFHQNTISIGHILWFLPFIIMQKIILDEVKLSPKKSGTIVAALTQIYTYIYALLAIIFEQKTSWQATNTKNTIVSSQFMNILWFNRIFVSIMLILIATTIFIHPDMLYNINAYILLGWAIYSTYLHTRYSFTLSRFVVLRKKQNQIKGFINRTKFLLWRFNWSVFSASLLFFIVAMVYYLSSQIGSLNQDWSLFWQINAGAVK
jgi:cellulose synthase (UDP-forming)